MTNHEPLPWDSEFFGFGVASLGEQPLGRAELRSALDDLRTRGVRLVYWAPPAADLDSDRAGRAESGRLVDRKTTFAVDDLAGLDPAPAASRRVRRYEHKTCTPELERLAIQSGGQSRFAVDPKIPRERFESLYRLWMRKSIGGDLAQGVLVAGEAGRIEGVITLADKDGAGSIGLIAVDESARGRGLGSALIRSALHWARARSLERMRVVTQGDNLPACRLYEKHGFERVGVQSFFHFWL